VHHLRGTCRANNAHSKHADVSLETRCSALGNQYIQRTASLPLTLQHMQRLNT
jgi:hypothetical protein